MWKMEAPGDGLLVSCIACQDTFFTKNVFSLIAAIYIGGDRASQSQNLMLI